MFFESIKPSVAMPKPSSSAVFLLILPSSLEMKAVISFLRFGIFPFMSIS